MSVPSLDSAIELNELTKTCMASSQDSVNPNSEDLPTADQQGSIRV